MNNLKKMSWQEAMFISKQESKIDKEKLSISNQIYGMDKSAGPYIMKVKDFPTEFSDWEGEMVDLRFEKLPSDVYNQQGWAFNNGVALAIKKNNKWFAMKNKTPGNPHMREVEIIPISEEEALNMLHLPEEWEYNVHHYNIEE